MIIEGILNLIKGALLWFINLIPAPESIEVSISGIANTFVEIVQGVAYILPIGDIMIMLGIWLAINTFTIGWRLIQRIWDALPFT